MNKKFKYSPAYLWGPAKYDQPFFDRDDLLPEVVFPDIDAEVRRIPLSECVPGIIYAPYIPLYVSRSIDIGKTFPGKRDPMLGERTGSRTYPILVSEVLEALKIGRAEHRKLLKEAQDGYKKKVIEELEKALKDAQAGTSFRTAILLDIPRSYLKEYDNALELLGATQRAGTDKIELTADEYERFVRNIWSWTNTFNSTASKYVAHMDVMKGSDSNDGLLDLDNED